MKRLILCSFLAFGLSGIVNAQADRNSSNPNSSGTSTSNRSNKAVKKKKKSTTRATPVNNRKIYHWKNGQRATPTGHEATGTNGSYSAIGRDTTKRGKQ